MTIKFLRCTLSLIELFFATLLLLCVPGLSIAQTPTSTIAARLPAGVKLANSVEGINEYTLENGLRVLLFQDQSKPTITVNVTYMVGSRHENYGETGMAHLLEHLVFKGSPKFPRLDEEFNKRGARSNGSTWLDRTNYFELMQASDDNLKWAIEMEADRMVNSFIAKKDLDSEMTVVRNEYERGETAPFQVMIKRLQSMAYDWHSYGRSTIGNRSDIENVKIENLQAFYRTYYQPDNATLVIAGKFDETKTLSWIAEYFGAIKKPSRVLPVFWTTEPTQDGERTFVIRRKGDIQIVALAYKVPAAIHPQSDALGFVNYILTDAPTGRLHKALVETKKAQQVIGFPLVGSHPGLLIIAAVVKKGDPVEPVREELQKIVEGLAATPITQQEIDRAKRSFANDFEKTLNDHENIGVGLSEYIALGDWRLFFVGRDKTALVTAKDISGVAGAYLKRDNRTVGLFLPEDAAQRADIPSAPTLASVLADFKPKAAQTQAEAFDPSFDNLDARTKRHSVGGIKVAFIQKKTRGATVHVDSTLRFGNLESLTGRTYIGGLTGVMLSRGTTKFTRPQLADEFDRLKMAGTFSKFETTKTNVVAAIELMGHIYRNPSFPSDEFEQLKKQAITGAEAQKSEPAAIAQEVLGKHFNLYQSGDPRYATSVEERIAGLTAVTLDQIKTFHRDYYGASAGEITVVGDFDEVAVLSAIKQVFGDWASKAKYAPILSEYKEIPSKVELIHTPDKENGALYARINVDVRDDSPDYPALVLMNYLMGGGSGLNSRFAERIRQRDGLSYGVGSTLRVNPLDSAGSWFIQAIAAPQNLDKVENALREEISRALKDGFTADEIARAKSGFAQFTLQGRAQDGALVSSLGSNEYLGRTFANAKERERVILALRPEQIRDVMRKYIDLTKLTVVKAGDKSKIK